MDSDAELRHVLATVLELDEAAVGPETNTDTVKGWDSVKHMRLVIALEEVFGITIPDDEVVTMTSYPIVALVVRELLAKS